MLIHQLQQLLMWGARIVLKPSPVCWRHHRCLEAATCEQVKQLKTGKAAGMSTHGKEVTHSLQRLFAGCPLGWLPVAATID
jgi:hypothetical protein